MAAAEISPLRLQPEFQRLRSEMKAAEEKHFLDRTSESEKAMTAKRDELFAFIKDHKRQVAER